MQYRALGRTGLTVSAIGFGGWAIGGAFGPVDEASALAALNRAHELGCTLFSTSDAYGESEARLGRALRGWRREEIVIATKGGQGGGRANFSERHLRESVEASLIRLGVDAIDVYHLDHPSLELIQLGRAFDVLQALRREGKIRHAGVTIHDPQEGIQALEAVEAVEAVYNLFDRRAEKALFSACQAHQAGLIIREPLARGFLSGALGEEARFETGDVRTVWPRPLVAKRVRAAEAYKPAIPQDYPDLATLALRFALEQPGVSSVLPDLATPAEVETAMAVPDRPPLTEATRQQIDATARTIF